MKCGRTYLTTAVRYRLYLNAALKQLYSVRDYSLRLPKRVRPLHAISTRASSSSKRKPEDEDNLLRKCRNADLTIEVIGLGWTLNIQTLSVTDRDNWFKALSWLHREALRDYFDRTGKWKELELKNV